MEIKNKNVGFSLVELLVVIAIIAVLSASSVVGWGTLSAVMATRQSGEVIKDTIKNARLQVLSDNFEQSNIHFKKNYLIKEELFADSTLVMELNTGCQSSLPDGFTIKSIGKLVKKNERGSVMGIEYVFASDSVPTTRCFDFDSAKDAEWTYELTNDGDKRVIDFIHFNLNRNTTNKAKITKIKIGTGDESDYQGKLVLTLVAPYAKAQYLKASKSVSSPIKLYLNSVNDSTIKEEILLP